MGIDLKGARILVAGGGSLVGSHLAKALLARGVGEIVVFDPIAFDDVDALGTLKDDPRVTMVPGDLMKLHQVIRHMDGIDGAVNLAAFMTLGLSQNPLDAVDLNVRGHLHFLEASVARSGIASLRRGKSTIPSMMMYATCTPLGANSLASACASQRCPPLAAAKAAVIGLPRQEAVAPVTIKAPPPSSTMVGRTCLAT